MGELAPVIERSFERSVLEGDGEEAGRESKANSKTSPSVKHATMPAVTNPAVLEQAKSTKPQFASMPPQIGAEKKQKLMASIGGAGHGGNAPDGQAGGSNHRQLARLLQVDMQEEDRSYLSDSQGSPFASQRFSGKSEPQEFSEELKSPRSPLPPKSPRTFSPAWGDKSPRERNKRPDQGQPSTRSILLSNGSETLKTVTENLTSMGGDGNSGAAAKSFASLVANELADLLPPLMAGMLQDAVRDALNSPLHGMNLSSRRSAGKESNGTDLSKAKSGDLPAGFNLVSRHASRQSFAPSITPSVPDNRPSHDQSPVRPSAGRGRMQQSFSLKSSASGCTAMTRRNSAKMAMQDIEESILTGRAPMLRQRSPFSRDEPASAMGVQLSTASMSVGRMRSMRDRAARMENKIIHEGYMEDDKSASGDEKSSPSKELPANAKAPSRENSLTDAAIPTPGQMPHARPLSEDKLPPIFSEMAPSSAEDGAFYDDGSDGMAGETPNIHRRLERRDSFFGLNGRNQETCESVRVRVETELTQDLHHKASVSQEGGLPRTRFLPVLRILGILPWDLYSKSAMSYSREMSMPTRLSINWKRPSAWYQWFCMLVVTAASAELAAQAYWAAEAKVLYTKGVYINLVLAICSVAGMLSVGTPLGSPNLVRCNLLFHCYMGKRGYLNAWMSQEKWRVGLNLFVWALVNSLSIWRGLWSPSYAVATFIVSSLAQTCIYICEALSGLLDLFGNTLVEHDRILDAVTEWRDLQAVLRKGSSSVEWCMFVLQVTVVSCVLIELVELTEGRTTLLDICPIMPLLFQLVHTFFRAAHVTDKCTRMPSLLNLFFSQEMDTELEYVVNYVNNSAAGFYVFEVRVTTAIALKLVYGCAAVIFAFTRFRL